jgi:hypothetical protein
MGFRAMRRVPVVVNRTHHFAEAKNKPFLLLKITKPWRCRPLVEIRFDCARLRSLSRRTGGSLMWASIAGVLVVLSIAMLIAHAFDAFRPD